MKIVKLKRQMRFGVFETNSSSTHTLTIAGKNNGKYFTVDPKDVPDDPVLAALPGDNEVHVTLGQFGWECTAFNNAYDKLSYALTMVLMTECNLRNHSEDKIYSIDEFKEKYDFYKTKGFNDINELIQTKLNCDGINIDNNLKINSFDKSDGSLYVYYDTDYYIDHGSCDEYSSLDDFLNEYGVTLEDFIFDKNIIVITKNDNMEEDEFGSIQQALKQQRYYQ